MDLTPQSIFLDVSDLKQSVEFYRDVLAIEVVSEADRVTALMINEAHRPQVLQLRELGRNAVHGGRDNSGLRMFFVEVPSLDELDAVQRRYVARRALLWHAGSDIHRGFLGVDPDRIQIAVAASPTGSPITAEA
jgi:catechol-2,3-dioxygenase